MAFGTVNVGNPPLDGNINADSVGQPNGLATLDENGKLVQAQVPDTVAMLDANGKLLGDVLPDNVVTVDADGKLPGDALPSDAITATQLTEALGDKADSDHTHAVSDFTSGTLPIARGGTGVANMTGTDYSTYRPRGIAILSAEPATLGNGCVAFVYDAE